MTTSVKPARDSAPLADAPPSRTAIVALFFATLFWGCGFTWAKAGGEAVNHLRGVGDGAALGPILFLGIRFISAGILWFALFPAARSGWTMRNVLWAILLGAMLSLGLMLQHLGLDRTSEAVSAFLTSLTIVFVPTLATITLKKAPPKSSWVSIVIAAAGVWLMTAVGAAAHLGVGEILGMTCALVFSIQMLAVNAIVPRDNPFRMAGGQLLVTGMITLCVVPFLRGGSSSLAPSAIAQLFVHKDIWSNLLLLIIFPTIGAFGLANVFQPRIDPTRAMLIYILEPVVAAIYAYVAIGRTMNRLQLIGAAMIVIANALVELFEAWTRSKRGEKAKSSIAPAEIV